MALLVVAGCLADDFAPPATPTESATTGDSQGTVGEAGEGTGSASVDPDGSASGSGADNCPEPDNSVAFVDGLQHLGRGGGDTFIEILDLVTRDRLVYSCTATQGITIWDAEDDNEPWLLVENVGPAGLAHDQFPRCQHLALDPASTRAVITNRGDEIQPEPWLFLYDLADPAQPEPLRGWTGDASIEGVVLDGDRIYAAAHRSGILVFEDQGGDSLVLVGEFADASSDAWQPVLVDSTLLVAEGTTGLRVYDVSADDPVLLDTLPLPGSSKHLSRDGDRLWVAAAAAVVGLDISDAAAPTIVAERDVPGTALAVAMGADGVLFTAEWDEVRGYDATDASMPLVWQESVPTGDDFSRVLTLATDADDRRLYAGEWTGMHAFSQNANPTAPDILATPVSVQFGDVSPGETRTRAFVVRNNGTETLQVFSTDKATAAMSVDPVCFEIEAGEAVAIEATFAPETDSADQGSFILRTNDPDEPAYYVRASGNVPGLDIGDPAPELGLSDLEGNTWSLADLEGKVAVLAYFATF